MIAGSDDTPMRPLVSIIIPNYNHARYLGAALDSVLAQTYPNHEVIVVDDGSTDDSAAVVGRFSEQFGDRLRPIFQPNQGLSGARNTGIRAARGDYIALLDADDLLDPPYLEQLVAVLAGSDGALGAYCGFRFVDQDGQPLPRVENRVFEPDALYGELLNGNFWVPESLLAARTCYIEAGEFDTSLRACEDWDVWLRIARQARLVGIPDVLIRYRVVSGSMSSDPQRMLVNRLTVLGKHVGPLPLIAAKDAAHAAYGNAFLRAAVEYLQNGAGDRAYDCLHKAAFISPDLLRKTATHYELACSVQDRGFSGRAEYMDVEASRRLISALIDRLMAEPDLAPWSTTQRNAIEARSQLALGMLYNQQGDRRTATSNFWRAGRLDASLFANREFLGWLGRSALDRRSLSRLKRRLPGASSRVL